MQFLKDYLTPLLKWWWLIILAPLIAAGSAYLFARQLPPVYQAKTTLLIGRAIQDPNPSGNEFSMSYQLATEYANMAMREPVQNAAKAALGLSDLPKYEATARGIFLEIAVIHTDPRFAQAVANVLAQQLILLSPVNMTQTSGTDQQFVENQLKELQDNIEQTRKEINAKQDSLSSMNSALDIEKTQNDLKTLEDKMATMQSIYSNLFSSTREAAFNTLSVFDTASLPTVPIGPRKTLIVLLAAFSGLAFAIGAAYLIEFLDDTIKNPDEISGLIDVPAIGYIGEIQGFKPTYVASNPRSPVADAFRGLRTNLEFMSVDRPIKKLIITSPEASDGKTTIAINLAIAIAQSEKKVILVDADLRSPSVHRYLGISGNSGLSDVFLDRIKLKDAMVEWDGTPKFMILPAGVTPPNSAELLGSKKMDKILEELTGMADFIVIDGSPGFIVDSIVLSAKADGVLLVVNMGETRRGSTKAVVEQLKRVDANLIGLVLNRISRGSAYYGSNYYSSYYSKEPVTRPIPSITQKKKWNLRFQSARIFSRFLPDKRMPKVKTSKKTSKQAQMGDPLYHFDGNGAHTTEGVTNIKGNVFARHPQEDSKLAEVPTAVSVYEKEADTTEKTQTEADKEPEAKKAAPKTKKTTTPKSNNKNQTPTEVGESAAEEEADAIMSAVVEPKEAQILAEEALKERQPELAVPEMVEELQPEVAEGEKQEAILPKEAPSVSLEEQDQSTQEVPETVKKVRPKKTRSSIRKTKETQLAEPPAVEASVEKPLEESVNVIVEEKQDEISDSNQVAETLIEEPVGSTENEESSKPNPPVKAPKPRRRRTST
jgi:succinoglycan biosynthesis transport protein ExoP